MKVRNCSVSEKGVEGFSLPCASSERLESTERVWVCQKCRENFVEFNGSRPLAWESIVLLSNGKISSKLVEEGRLSRLALAPDWKV